jgi:predicted aspartyl protease
MYRRIIAPCLFAIASTNSLQAQEGVNRPGATYVGYENGASVPFELRSGFLIVVPVRVGERSDLRFILDTGATRSVVDRRLVRQVASPSRVLEVFSFDRRLQIETTIVDHFEVGPIHAVNPEIEIIQLSEYSELAKDADGIVGMDLLKESRRILIDYSKKIVWFSLADVGTKPIARARCFIVTVKVQGAAMRLAIDTGFEGIAIHENRLRLQVPNLRTEGDPVSVEMGHLKTTKVRVPDVNLGGAPETREILLMNAPRENEIDGIDGYLGPAALHATRIEFDFEKRILRWQ